MVIEKLKSEDIPGLLQLYTELVPFGKSVDEAAAIYEEILQDENYFLVVVKEGVRIIGSALGVCCKTLTVPFLVIEDVIVKDGLRGMGIGQKLMSALDEFAATKHCAYAILVSSDYRKEAHIFYEKVGFTDGARGFRKWYDKARRQSMG